MNVIWFAELYEYDSKEENSIASVMALLETLDEGVAFTPEEYAEMIECLESNRDCEGVEWAENRGYPNVTPFFPIIAATQKN